MVVSSTATVTLAEYIERLVDAAGKAEPASLARIREVVGDRTARIRLESAAVDVAFSSDGRLSVRRAASDGRVEGEGTTTDDTVLNLLDARLELVDSITDGRLHVQGRPDDIVRMFIAIEILLDVAARSPEMQRLARIFRAQRVRTAQRDRPARAMVSDETTLLRRLNLLTTPV